MVPEVVLHKALVQGIRAVRDDSRILDSMFQNVPQDNLQAMKDVILKQKINLSINYPRADAIKLPMISIILKNEAEAHAFIGDIMGTAPNYGLPDPELSYELLNGGLASDMIGLPAPITSALSLKEYEYNENKSRTKVTLYDPAGELLTLGAIPDSYLWVADGSAAGERLRILSISGNQIVLDGLFKEFLDASSKVEIRPTRNEDAVLGEPSRVYKEGSTNLVRKGANYDVQYQLSIVSGHQDEALYLYSIIKAILFSQKKFMESQGIMALKISGTDFAPRSDFLPTEAFQRVLTMQFVYPFSFIEELPTYSKIAVGIETDTSSSCGTTSFEVSI